MARIPRFPRYPARPHRSGQARITINRQAVYLGPFGSPESYRRYEQEMAAWRVRVSAGLGAAPTGPAPPCLTVADAVARYYDHLTRTQLDEDGRQKQEVKTIRYALRPLVLLHGTTPPGQFGPKALKEVRVALLHGYDDPAAKGGKRGPNCRKTVNRHVVRIRAVFRWAEEEELIEGGVWNRLRSVRSLAEGDEGCEDYEDVMPPPLADVTDALSKANHVVRGMALVSMLTGARPSELYRLTPGDVVRDGVLSLSPGVQLECGPKVWAARLKRHKTRRKGCLRVLLFGPRAQEALRPFLERDASQPLFRPAEAVAAMRAKRAAARKRPPSPAQIRRDARRKPGRPVADAYDRRSYRQAVHRACRSAGVPEWNPYTLRHLAATVIASEFGLDVASAVLGHKSLRTTLIYARDDLLKAADALSRSG